MPERLDRVLDTRGLVEMCALTMGCVWTALSYADRAQVAGAALSRASDPDLKPGGGWYLTLPSLALFAEAVLAGVLRLQQRALPVEWLEASRTCPDSGVLYATLPSMALLSLLSQSVGSASFPALSFAFWCSVALFGRWALDAFNNPLPLASLLPQPFDAWDVLLASGTAGLWAHSARSLGYDAVMSVAPGQPRWAGALGPMLWLLFALRLRAWLLRVWLLAFRRSFTVGEAVLVGHAVALATADYLGFSVRAALQALPGARAAAAVAVPLEVTAPMLLAKSELVLVLQGGVLGVLALALVLWRFFEQHAVTSNETLDVNPREPPPPGLLQRRRSADWGAGAAHALPARAVVAFYGATALWLGVEVSLWVGGLLGGKHPVLWVRDYALGRRAHVVLLAYWIAALAVGLPLIHWVAANLAWPLIITRKLYHLLALAMFAPAVLLAPDFMRLSFGLALAVLLVVEYVRIARVPPLGRTAHAYLRSYTDSRDEGTAILTHVYLLLGCALPLWLFPAYAPATQRHAAMPYAALGGLVMLGAGDAAGAIIGSTIGQVRWPGGRKTLEGTLAATLASLSTVSLLAAWQLRHEGGPASVRWQEVLLATLLTCLLEAFTKQIDNLTLPVFYSARLYLPPNVWRL